MGKTWLFLTMFGIMFFISALHDDASKIYETKVVDKYHQVSGGRGNINYYLLVNTGYGNKEVCVYKTLYDQKEVGSKVNFEFKKSSFEVKNISYRYAFCTILLIFQVLFGFAVLND